VNNSQHPTANTQKPPKTDNFQQQSDSKNKTIFNYLRPMLTRLLFVRFSSFGDIVLTTPAVRCAKEQWYGEVEIHYLTKKQYGFLLDNNPHIHTVHTIERSTNEIIETLKELQFDYIIDLHHNARSFFLKRKLGMMTFAFTKLNFEKWLLVNTGINRLPNVHIVDRYLATLRAFKIENDGRGLDYFIPLEEEVNANELPDGFKTGFVTFVIGGQYRGKKLSPEKIARICTAISQPVILLGGPEDEPAANIITKLTGGRVWSAVGKYSFNQSASIIKQSLAVITHDTGLMHVASAFKKPIISVWGGTIPGFGMYPYMPGQPSFEVESKHLKKRPCSKLGNRCKYKPCRCMDEIDEREITDDLNQIMLSVR
jgi:ADP-heptose:LPS heptosyltransferase